LVPIETAAMRRVQAPSRGHANFTSGLEPMNRVGRLLLEALRRLLVLLVGTSAAVTVISLLLGAALGSSATRSISLGFYLAGAALVLGGFFFGNRGPFRTVGERGPFELGRALRPATPDEMREAINMSAVFVALGFVLMAIGAAVDDRYRLL
jgi:hypothetical protein